jgi:Vacuolar sorting protein 9 (VPS9) domain
MEYSPKELFPDPQTFSLLPTATPTLIPRSLDPSILLQTLSSIHFTSLKLPLPDCIDFGFTQLVLFLKLTSSRHHCLDIQKYSVELLDFSSPLSSEKLAGVKVLLTRVLTDFEKKLKLEKVLDSQVLRDGLESYLTCLCYKSIVSRQMAQEVEKDLRLSQRILLLQADGLAESFRVNESLDLSRLWKPLASSILLFETATTPISKLFHLNTFFEILTRKHLSNSDDLLTMTIQFLLCFSSRNLISSLAFVQLRHNLEGKDLFVITTLQAALTYLSTSTLDYPLEIIKVLEGGEKLVKEDLVHGNTYQYIQKSASDWMFGSVGNEDLKERLQKTVKKQI